MRFPREFYYTQQSSMSQLTSRDTGIIDINAFVNDAPKFYRDSAVKTKRPKTIILDNIKLEDINPNDAYKFFFVLYEMTIDGFEMYLPINGYLQHINFLDFISSYLNGYNIYNQIGARSLSIPIASERFFILDTAMVNKLAGLYNGNNSGISFLKQLFDIFALIIDFKHMNHENEKSVDDEESVDEYLKRIEKILALNPEYLKFLEEAEKSGVKIARIDPKVSFLLSQSYAESKASRTLEELQTQLQNRHTQDLDLTKDPDAPQLYIDKLTRIKKLSILTSTWEHDCLQHIPEELNELSLEDCTISSNITQSRLKIDALELDKIKSSQSGLTTFLNSIDNLQYLSIDTLKVEESEHIYLQLKPLTHLKYLKSRGGQSVEFVNSILCQAPNLEDLVLELNTHSAELIFDVLPKLKKARLDLDGFIENIGQNYSDRIKYIKFNIHQFLSHTPQIEYLELSGYMVSFLCADEPLNLSYLKTINFRLGSISKELLEYILKVAPNLENINTSARLPSDVDIPSRIKITGRSLSAMTPPPNTQRDYNSELPKDLVEHHQEGFHQSMLIQKLIAFIEKIKLKSKEDINKLNFLKKGICHALSEYVQQYGIDETIDFLTHANQWAGEAPISENLANYFVKLCHLIDDYYIKINTHLTLKFVGENLKAILTKEDSMLLSNPWHTIAIKKEEEKWYVYDPNNREGIIESGDQDFLIAAIKSSLGTLVLVETSNPDLYNDCQTEIVDFKKFIENGGFLLSLSSLNEMQCTSFLNALKPKTIAEESLYDALTMCDAYDKQAWEIIPIRVCDTIQANYKRKCQHENLESLIIKMDQKQASPNYQDISQEDLLGIKDEIPNRLTENTKANAGLPSPSLIEPIVSFYTSISKALTTWAGQKEEHPQNILDFFDAEKILIQTKDEATLNSLRDQLQLFAHSCSKPIFYVNTADDLKLLAKRFRLTPDGEVVIEQGSKLKDFLNNEDSPKTILINFNNFSTEEIIQFNEILDPEPKINGITLAQGIRIIGLQNIGREDAYQEADFYSRFAKIREFHSNSAQQLPPVLSIKSFQEQDISDSTDDVTIQIFDSPAWKDILFGQLRIEGHKFSFADGKLMPPTLPINLVLENAPLDDPEFLEFWRQAIITRKISLNGRTYDVPEDFQLLQKTGYNFTNVLSVFRPDKTPPTHILNTQNLRFYLGCQIIQDGEIIYQQGLIEEGAKLSILLTEELSEGQWAQMLQTCQIKACNINVSTLPHVKVPVEFKSLIVNASYSTNPLSITQTPNVQQYLAHHSLSGLVVDVSDFDSSDLFGFNKTVKKPDGEYEFQSTNSWLLEKLSNGEKVILKGHFSGPLIQSIAAYLLLKPDLAKHLRLIADVQSPLEPFNPMQETLLNSEAPLSEEQQQSLLLLTNPKLNFSLKTQSAEAFTKARIKEIDDALAKQPFVFVTGLSGCGKTTFIKKHFQVFLEKDSIETWLKSDKDPSYLFFDEANLSHNNWLMFEGLLQQPPFIIFEGQYHSLHPNHKVIFAGNPTTYGDERILPKLFTHHPNVIVFDPIPPQTLKEEILLPLFSNTTLEAKADQICDEIIRFYQRILTYSTDRVLISPRELQSIAMLTIANSGEENPVMLAQHFAYTIGRQLIPQQHLKAFEQDFKGKISSPSMDTKKEFLMTASRQEPAQYLRDLLQLRAFRQQKHLELSDAQKTVGLGGLILEGEPGIGKSELLIEILHKEFHLSKAGPGQAAGQDVFYIIPPSISIEERKELLLKAFHEGAVVIIDEMNSGPMLESFLNALLMGSTPEGEAAKHPGFTVLATQNPSNKGGRREQSEAVLRRMIKFNLENYSKAEIISILKAQGFEDTLATVLACTFLERLQFSKQKAKKPEPSFRDLMRFAAKLKQHQSTMNYFSGSYDVIRLHHELKQLTLLQFSEAELCQFIEMIPTPTLVPAPSPKLISEFLNKLNSTHVDIIPTYLAKIDFTTLTHEEFESVVRLIESKDIQKNILHWWIMHQELSPSLLESSQLNLVLEKLNSWLSSNNLNTLLKDFKYENFKQQIEPIIQIYLRILLKNPSENLTKLLSSCDSPDRALFILSSIFQSDNFFIPDDSFEKVLAIISNHKFLQCSEMSAKDLWDHLLKKSNTIKSTPAIISWWIDNKIELNDAIITFMINTKHPYIQSTQNMSQEEFDFFVKSHNRKNQAYLEAIRALDTETNCPISFNGFIEILKLLKKQQKTKEEIINWMTHITLTDSGNTPVELWRLNDIVEILQEPTLINALFETLLKNEKITNALKDISSTSLIDAPLLMITCKTLMAHVKTISDTQFRHLLLNLKEDGEGIDKLFDHALGLNGKSIPEASIDRANLLAKRLSCLLFTSQPQDSSLLIDAQAYQIQCLLSYLKKYPEKKEEKEDLIEIFKLALEYHNSTNEKERQEKLNNISTNTASFVKKYQTKLTPAAYIANIVICLTVLPMFIFYLCSLFMNSKVFYSRENPMTEAVQQLAKDITALENIDGQVHSNSR